MANKEKRITIEKDGKKLDVTERQQRVYFSNLGYTVAKPANGRKTTKSSTKKDGE